VELFKSTFLHVQRNSDVTSESSQKKLPPLHACGGGTHAIPTHDLKLTPPDVREPASPTALLRRCYADYVEVDDSHFDLECNRDQRDVWVAVAQPVPPCACAIELMGRARDDTLRTKRLRRQRSTFDHKVRRSDVEQFAPAARVRERAGARRLGAI
jgi:hypothetical protein